MSHEGMLAIWSLATFFLQMTAAIYTIGVVLNFIDTRLTLRYLKGCTNEQITAILSVRCSDCRRKLSDAG
jgi:hypothetical protein